MEWRWCGDIPSCARKEEERKKRKNQPTTPHQPLPPKCGMQSTEGGKLAGQKRDRDPAPAFSLVSGDYDDDEDEAVTKGDEVNESEGIDELKKEVHKSTEPVDKKAKPAKEDSDDELPPLPDSFSTTVPRIAITKSPPLSHSSKKKESEEERKKSFLVPPQIWKRQANVSTEDTGSWTTNRRKTKKTQAVETM
jgi:hypothetical protein